MGRKIVRRVPHRRRREGKTDYRLRFKLLKGGKTRLVVRKSLNNIICQIIKHDSKGDKTIVSAEARELKKYGWVANCGNLPAAYLTGLLCALKAKKSDIKGALLDLGPHTSTKGSRLYSALKGALDGGLAVPFSEKNIPSDDRISGKHIADYAANLKQSKPEEYKRRFSLYLKNKLNPEDIVKHFEEVKSSIISTFSGKKPAEKTSKAKPETKKKKKK
jgi:large subunit ribosomal protein L18